MGASSSKAASKAPQAAAAAGRRQYPSTSSILNSATSTANAPSYSSPPATTNARAPAAPSPSQVHPDPKQAPPSESKNQQIDLDGRDPQFSSALRKLGPAIPVDEARPNSGSFPTSSQPPLGQQGRNIFPSASSASNPSLMIVQAREKFSRKFDEESENLGRGSFAGRTLITAKEISDVIKLKMAGKNDAEIEKQMRLRPGVVGELGAGNMVQNA